MQELIKEEPEPFQARLENEKEIGLVIALFGYDIESILGGYLLSMV